MNYKLMRVTLGYVLVIEAACMTFPLMCGIIYRERGLYSFGISMLICLAIGALLLIKQPQNKTMYAKEGYIIVAASWIVISVFGALPFFISGYIPNFIDALFETVSGFSTTGASILNDIDIFPKSLIFWRSFTHWIGGMGVLVFLVAILPLSGGSNLFLLRAESTGPSVNKLVPKVKSSAKILYGIYIALTGIEVIMLLAGGLNLFESLTISFGTAGTGGFSITNGGMGIYSPYVQIVVTVFMFLFGIDFSLYYLILLRKFRTAFESREMRVYVCIVISAIVIISFNCRHMYNTVFDAVRHSAFQVASLITTTGYSTLNYNIWPELSKTILIMLMFIGACTGSTGGGIKVYRIMVLLKSIAKEIKIAAHPRNVHKLTVNGRVVAHETVRAINVFMVSYLAIFAISLLLISVDNLGFTTNFTAVLATLNNIGPGLGAVGPIMNFSVYSSFSKIIFIANMLIGRLEIFPMLILFSPYTWKK